MRAALVCLLVVLAGCGGYGYTGPTASPEPGTATPGTPTPAPTPPETPTAVATASPDPRATGAGPSRTPTAPRGTPTPVAVEPADVTVEGGPLSVDAGRTLALGARVLGADVGTYPTVVVDPRPPSFTPRPSPFFRRLGLTADATDLETAAYVSGPERVYVSEAIVDRSTLLETTLVHEFVHVLQFREGRFGGLLARVGRGPDARMVRRGVVEGSAVYAADVYWVRHLRRGQRPAADIEQAYRNATGVVRYAVAPYRFGGRYVRARVDDPANLSRVYEHPPTTTEELIHRLPPGSEPPAPLRASERVGGDWRLADRARMGELFVRSVLRTELGERRAARGADGWGNDTRLSFLDGSDRGYAWVIRWDDRANATEFVGSFRAYLDRRADRRNGSWRRNGTAYRLVRPDDRTTVVLLGAPSFVRNASVGVESGAVRVALDG